MNEAAKKSRAKISTAFSARLDGLHPTAKLIAVLVLHRENSSASSGRRQTTAQRQEAIKRCIAYSEQALGLVDSILSCNGGLRNDSHPDVLGTIAVETTAAGIKELAVLDAVKAILEDQPISSV